MIRFFRTGKYIVLGRVTYVMNLFKYKIIENKIRFYYCDVKVGIYDLDKFIDYNYNIVDILPLLDKYRIKEIEYELSPIDLEAEKYQQRIDDGIQMSINLMSELRVNSKVNNLPRQVNDYIEQKLEKVKTNIDRGWWVTALEELEQVTVESYFTQELYDRLYNTITTYIAENY